MIKYIQETWDDNITLKINDITMEDWYVDDYFLVHANMKSHTGSVLTINKAAIKKQRIRRSIQKFLQKKNW